MAHGLGGKKSAVVLTVDRGHLGTPESSWRAAGLPSGLTPLRMAMPERVVVIAPHPDDEVLGVGGLLTHLARMGTAIDIVAVPDGEACVPAPAGLSPAGLAARRAGERDVALARLGVRPERVTRIGLPDGRVAAHEDDLVDAIGAGLDRRTVCLAPWAADGHPDHDAAGRAAVAACARAGAPLAAYLVWMWHWATPGCVAVPWGSARRVDLGRRAVAAKRWAMAAFTSQIVEVDGAGAVLPSAVLARFRRPFEVVLT